MTSEFSEINPSIMGVIEDVIQRLERQMTLYPQGFPADRNGVRLGLASIEDELKEALTEWNYAKRHLHWNDVYEELLDIIAVGVYTAIEIRMSIDKRDEDAQTS